MALQIIFAYILDLIFGDPRRFPHPVKGIGWLIKKIEPPLRRVIGNERRALLSSGTSALAKARGERIGGIILAISVVGVTWCLSFVIIEIASSINRYLGFALSTLIIYSSLAVKDLDVESMDVYSQLEKKDMASARKKLSLIVGRDTHNLGYQEVVRATVETVSENIVDGIISPLFYAFLGGAPLALAYKAVNTLDSMVGYKNELYKDFGWASAKMDTLANFIPARLSILLLPPAAFLAGKDALNSWRIGIRDGAKNPSRNSGIPEACVAGALGIRLGGLNHYPAVASLWRDPAASLLGCRRREAGSRQARSAPGGKGKADGGDNSRPVLKPYIGDDINALTPGHIKESIKISYISSALFLIIGVFLTVCIKRG